MLAQLARWFDDDNRRAPHSELGTRPPAEYRKVGPNSNARFQSQHYSAGSAQSTLAGTLMRAVILWPYLGIDTFREPDVRAWILRNTERDHFYLDGTCIDLVGELERYLRARLGPVFEGG